MVKGQFDKKKNFYELTSNTDLIIKQNGKETIKYSFDRIFEETIDQENLFKESFSQVANEILSGVNIGVISYGEKESGKSYTLFGDNIKSEGIIQKTLIKIFDYIYAPNNEEISFELRFSAVSIKDNKINDLLIPKNIKELETSL